MAHGKELRTESLINSMEKCGKTTSASSAACTEMWASQFVGAGVSWGGDHFSKWKATFSSGFIVGQKMRPQSKQGPELEAGIMANPPKALLWAAEGDWCARDTPEYTWDTP